MVLVSIIMIATAFLVARLLRTIRRRIKAIDKQVRQQYERQEKKDRG